MQTLAADRALVLFSGGQDSSIALAWALRRFRAVETIGFDYGQRHGVELRAREAVRDDMITAFPDWAEKLGPDTLVEIGGLGRLSETALTRPTEIAMAASGLPTTFVPGRNLVFLVFAGALAYRRDAGVLVGGMSEVDFSGYPDCREEALDAQIGALRLGLDASIAFAAPLLRLSKAASWRLAFELGGDTLVDLIRINSHTCYLGERGALHAWGYGCGACPACVLRVKGWEEYDRDGVQREVRSK